MLPWHARTRILREGGGLYAEKVRFQLNRHLFSVRFLPPLGLFLNILIWKGFSQRSTAHVQSVSDSTAHEQLFSSVVKRSFFRQGSRTLVKGWFSSESWLSSQLLAYVHGIGLRGEAVAFKTYKIFNCLLYYVKNLLDCLLYYVENSLDCLL